MSKPAVSEETEFASAGGNPVRLSSGFWPVVWMILNAMILGQICLDDEDK